MRFVWRTHHRDQPTEEDTTALYIRHLLKDHSEISITRLASGLPIGETWSTPTASPWPDR